MPPMLARVNLHGEIHPGLPAHPPDSPPIPGSEQSSPGRQLSRILSGGETCIHPHSGTRAATRKILVVVTEKKYFSRKTIRSLAVGARLRKSRCMSSSITGSLS